MASRTKFLPSLRDTCFSRVSLLVTAKEILAVAVFGGFCLFSEMAKGCQWYAYEELKKQGKKIRVMPSVVLSEKAGYRDGVVSLTNTEDCKVMLHELEHHYQWEKFGPAKTLAEWEWREREAVRVVRRVE